MASRRDQLQSYQFRTQRVISALVMREADPAIAPLRRGIGAIISGLMVAVFVGVGFGVYGLLTQQGSTAWKADDAVVIEKETGASFVYLDGVLHPMLNYASALLATDPSKRAIYREPAAALDTVPRGTILGIPGAPDSLPDASQAARGPWSLCATVGATPGSVPRTTLAISAAPSGGVPLGDRGLLVQDADTGTAYLVWHGKRYAVASSLVIALFGTATAMPATAAWLDGIPAGADIAPLSIPDRGDPSPAATPYDIGDVLSTPVAAGGDQYWIVLAGGLAPLTQLQKDIAIEEHLPGPTAIDVSRATAIGQVSLPGIGAGDVPPKAPELEPATGPVCAAFAGSAAPTISIGGTGVAPGTPTGSADDDDVADYVAVPPGHYALVHATSGYDLVTDVGVRYAVASDDVLASLGYAASDAMTVPASLLGVIPAGPALDPQAAGASVDAPPSLAPGSPAVGLAGN